LEFESRFSTDYRILILGTMPSEISLKQQEYYANPRNQFWRIMQSVFHIPADATYTEQMAGIKRLSRILRGQKPIQKIDFCNTECA